MARENRTWVSCWLFTMVLATIVLLSLSLVQFCWFMEDELGMLYFLFSMLPLGGSFGLSIANVILCSCAKTKKKEINKEDGKQEKEQDISIEEKQN